MTNNQIHSITTTPLQKGDCIGIVAPGSPFDKVKFSKGVSVIEKMGFHPVFNQKIFLANGYLAGPDIHRAEMINNAFIDDQIKAVWCARGGYGAIRVLDHLDYESICSHPKIFIGCSDMSSILNTMYSKCNMVSFHGPMIESLGTADDLTIKSLYEALCVNQRLTVLPQKSIIITPGKSSGKVAGGNLTTLCHLIGTPFQPDFSGCILLIEDTGEAPYRIDRMLSQMKMAGCFKDLSGMILGSFEKCGEFDQIYHIVVDIFSDMEFPILAGFDIGHGLPNLTIPFGVEALLDTDVGALTYMYPHLDFKNNIKHDL
jgi:muramoyltetrapeptide carboxypeptidase